MIQVANICWTCGQLYTGTEKDSDECSACRAPEPERHETGRLFEPAPNVIPGQQELT